MFKLIVLVYPILTQRDVRKTYEKHHLECHWSAIFIHFSPLRNAMGDNWQEEARNGTMSLLSEITKAGGLFHKIPLVVTGTITINMEQ